MLTVEMNERVACRCSSCREELTRLAAARPADDLAQMASKAAAAVAEQQAAAAALAERESAAAAAATECK